MKLEEQLKTILETHGVTVDDSLISELLLAFAKWQQVTVLALHSQILRRLKDQEQRILALEEATGIENFNKN